jgi:hypothetical protein
LRLRRFFRLQPEPSANDGASANIGITLPCLPPAALAAFPDPAGVIDEFSAADHSHRIATSLPLDLNGFEMVRAALWTEFEETGHGGVLNEVIDRDEEILEMCRIGHQGRAHACMRLSASLYTQLELAPAVSAPAVSPLAPANDGVSREDHLETTRMIRDTLWVEYEQTRDATTLEQVIQQDERILALCPVGHLDRALACAYLASSLQSKLCHTVSLSTPDLNHNHVVDPSTLELSSAALRSWLDHYRDTDDPKQLDQLISVRRRALEHSPRGHPYRYLSCHLLGQSLIKKYRQSGDVAVLEQVVQLQREAYALCPPSEDEMRAAITHDLGMSLHNLFLHTHDIAVIDDAIQLLRECLVLYPHAHPDRVTSCRNLALVLTARYDHGPDLIFLDEAIMLEREVLELCPPDHPKYAASCNNLACSLKLRYRQTGDADLLHEVIELQRKTLAMFPSGHPNRSVACANLAHTLGIFYNQRSDIGILDESLGLKREALSLFSTDSPHRAKICSELIESLRIRYRRIRDVSILREVTQLQREALALCSPRHPDRVRARLSLAGTLKIRHEQTGDMELLYECIGLEREALSLCTPGNPDHWLTCEVLAASLTMLHANAHDHQIINEAIELGRQLLAGCSPGSEEHTRHSCNFAAYVSRRQLEQPGIVDDLNEAIDLCRSVLHSTACSDTARIRLYVNLASCLKQLYKETDDANALDEAIIMLQNASTSSSSFNSGHVSLLLSEVYLLWGARPGPASRLRTATSRALESLKTASYAEDDSIGEFMHVLCSSLLNTIWHVRRSLGSSDLSQNLVPIYARAIDNLPLMAAFALNTRSRLRGLRSYTEIGSRACVTALEAEDPLRAIEMLDQAHGIVWAQALYQRDPELTGVPHELAIELRDLLRAMDLPTNTLVDHGHLIPQDVRHAQNSRIQTLIGEIRNTPGLERFMRGFTFAQIRQAALDHPVVILVTADSESYAVVISHASQDVPDVIKLDVTWETMLQLRSNMHRSGARWRTSTEEGCSEAIKDADDSERLMRPGGYDHSLAGVLSRLWKLIVKPVLSHLGFEASLLSHMTHIGLTFLTEARERPTASTPLVCYWTLRISSHPRGRHLHSVQSRMLFGLRGHVVCSHTQLFATCTARATGHSCPRFQACARFCDARVQRTRTFAKCRDRDRSRHRHRAQRRRASRQFILGGGCTFGNGQGPRVREYRPHRVPRHPERRRPAPERVPPEQRSPAQRV